MQQISEFQSGPVLKKVQHTYSFAPENGRLGDIECKTKKFGSKNENNFLLPTFPFGDTYLMNTIFYCSVVPISKCL